MPPALILMGFAYQLVYLREYQAAVARSGESATYDEVQDQAMHAAAAAHTVYN